MIRLATGEQQEFSELGLYLFRNLTAETFCTLDEILSEKAREISAYRLKKRLKNVYKWRLDEFKVLAKLLKEEEYDFFWKWHMFVENVNPKELAKLKKKAKGGSSAAAVLPEASNA